LVGLDGCEVRLCDPCARVRPRVPCVSRHPPGCLFTNPHPPKTKWIWAPADFVFMFGPFFGSFALALHDPVVLRARPDLQACVAWVTRLTSLAVTRMPALPTGVVSAASQRCLAIHAGLMIPAATAGCRQSSPQRHSIDSS